MGPAYQSQRVVNLPPAHVAWVFDRLNLFLDAFSTGEAQLLQRRARPGKSRRGTFLSGIGTKSRYQGRYELTKAGD